MLSLKKPSKRALSHWWKCSLKDTFQTQNQEAGHTASHCAEAWVWSCSAHATRWSTEQWRVKAGLPEATKTQLRKHAWPYSLRMHALASQRSQKNDLKVTSTWTTGLGSSFLLYDPSLLKFLEWLMRKCSAHLFLFVGWGKKKNQHESTWNCFMNFNHSKCVLTVVIKSTLPQIQRTRHQFGIQKYHILKLGSLEKLRTC